VLQGESARGVVKWVWEVCVIFLCAAERSLTAGLFGAGGGCVLQGDCKYVGSSVCAMRQ